MDSHLGINDVLGLSRCSPLGRRISVPRLPGVDRGARAYTNGTTIPKTALVKIVDATGAWMYPAPPADVEAINRVWFEMA